MNHELLDSLYATRRELTRLIVATASEALPADSLHQLLVRRDQVTWAINRILQADLTASLAQIESTCKAIDDSTARLKSLTATAADIAKAIGIAKDVLNAAAIIIGAVAG